MSTRSERFEYGFAGPEDREELLNVFESMDFKGDISVLYTRRPDPYQSLLNEGEKVLIPVVREKERGKIIGLGCCVVRKAYINGEIKNTGYLTGLKLLPEFKKCLPHISKVYEFLHKALKQEVDLYYTTILKENIPAQKMLERKRKNMPEYRYKGEYTVYLFRTGIKAGLRGHRLEIGNRKGVEAFYNNHLPQFNLSPTGIDLHGIVEKDLYTLRDPSGEVIAACALWNQQSCKQYIVTGYGGIYAYLKKLPLKWFGYPNLPKENHPVNYASMTAFCVKDHDAALAGYFIQKIAETAKEYDLLMFGLFENHPVKNVFDHIKHIKYQSKLYTVHWEDEGLELENRPVNVEVGLL